eukprot:324529_1
MSTRQNNHEILTALYSKDNYSACIEFIRKCIRTDTNYCYYYLIYGLCLRQIGKPEDAILQFQIAWKINPQDNMLRFLYGNQLFMRQHFDKSAKIHRAFFDNKYQLKHSAQEYALEICVQFGEVFINKILYYKTPSSAQYTLSLSDQRRKQLYDILYTDTTKAPKGISKRRRVKYATIARTVLTQGMKHIKRKNYAFDFCYLSRRLISVDIIDMKWCDAFSKYEQVWKFQHKRVPEDYDRFYSIPIVLKKYQIAEKLLLQWIKEPRVLDFINNSTSVIDNNDHKILFIYCHLLLLYCDSKQIHKCKNYIKKGKLLCSKLRDSQHIKDNYNLSAVFYFHWVYAYYLSTNNTIDPNITSDAVFIALMQFEMGYGSDLIYKMCFYFGKYFHYAAKNIHLAKFFYSISISRTKFNQKEPVYYNYAKLLYQMGKWKLSLKYWEKSKNLLFCRGNQSEYLQFKNLMLSKQIEYQYSIYCTWCKTKQTSTNSIVFKKCARCRSVIYCSKYCQKKDWKKSHRFVCKKVTTALKHLENWMGNKMERLCICKPFRDQYLKYNKWMIRRDGNDIISSFK